MPAGRIISPTASGHEAMWDVGQTRRASLASVTADWSEEDRNALARLLARLNDSIARATGCCDPIIAQPAS